MFRIKINDNIQINDRLIGNQSTQELFCRAFLTYWICLHPK